ncbi:MAG: SDR family oxidoreductase, partial [Planctomycetota bacterium]
GLIVNVTSTWGRSAAPLVAPYCASKFAVEALTRSVSMESGPGVIVCAVNPGVIATDMLTQAFGGDVSAYPGPDALAPRWLRWLEEAGPSLHGRSIDL